MNFSVFKLKTFIKKICDKISKRSVREILLDICCDQEKYFAHILVFAI